MKIWLRFDEDVGLGLNSAYIQKSGNATTQPTVHYLGHQIKR